MTATALGLACPPGSEPLQVEGLTDRCLPDEALTRRTLRRTQYALYAAAFAPDVARDAMDILGR